MNGVSYLTINGETRELLDASARNRITDIETTLSGCTTSDINLTSNTATTYDNLDARLEDDEERILSLKTEVSNAHTTDGTTLNDRFNAIETEINNAHTTDYSTLDDRFDAIETVTKEVTDAHSDSKGNTLNTRFNNLDTRIDKITTTTSAVGTMIALCSGMSTYTSLASGSSGTIELIFPTTLSAIPAISVSTTNTNISFTQESGSITTSKAQITITNNGSSTATNIPVYWAAWQSSQSLEVIDARQDVNGTVQKSLSARLSSDFNKLSSEIGTLTNLQTNKTNLVDSDNELYNHIGVLDNLTTTNKNNLVAAINESITDIGGSNQSIGDLTTLKTDAKDSLVNSNNELYDNIGNIVELEMKIDGLATNLIESINWLYQQECLSVSGAEVYQQASDAIGIDLLDAASYSDIHYETYSSFDRDKLLNSIQTTDLYDEIYTTLGDKLNQNISDVEIDNEVYTSLDSIASVSTIDSSDIADEVFEGTGLGTYIGISATDIDNQVKEALE